MITLDIHNITGIAISSPINPNDYEALCAMLPPRSRIAMANITPDDTAMRIITRILGVNSELYRYIGRYHAMNGPLAENIDSIEKLVGSRATFLRHQTSEPSVARVLANQWNTDGLSCVLFAQSTDGYYAFLRGCGVEFSEMASDIIAPFRQPHAPVSTITKTLENACDFVAPYYTVDATGHDTAMTEIYSLVSEWIEDIVDQGELARFKSRVHLATDAAIRNAEQLSKETRFLNGLAICDFRPLLRRGEPVSFPAWKHHVREEHQQCVLCSISPGLPEDRVCIDTRPWGKPVELDTLLSSITKRNRPVAWISLSDWAEFVTAWRMRYVKI